MGLFASAERFVGQEKTLNSGLTLAHRAAESRLQWSLTGVTGVVLWPVRPMTVRISVMKSSYQNVLKTPLSDPEPLPLNAVKHTGPPSFSGL